LYEATTLVIDKKEKKKKEKKKTFGVKVGKYPPRPTA